MAGTVVFQGCAVDQYQVKLNDILMNGLRDGEFTHAEAAFGNIDRGPILSSNTWGEGERLFDLASMTKGLSTGFLMYEASKDLGFNLNEGCGKTLDKLGIKFSGSELMKQQSLFSLLNHSSSFPAWGCLWINRLTSVENLWDNREKHILAHLNRILETRPEEKPVYSDLGYILCGLILERMYGESQDILFSKSVGSKLKSFLGYLPMGSSIASSNRSLAISTGYCKVRQRDLVGEVHDENCASLAGVSGHAGLFGSAASVAEAFSVLDGSGYFEENAKFVDPSRRDGGHDGLCGLRQNVQNSLRQFCAGNAIGHLGFTGTSFFIDPGSKNYVVFLTNRVIKARLSSGIVSLRKQIHDLAGDFFNN